MTKLITSWTQKVSFATAVLALVLGVLLPATAHATANCFAYISPNDVVPTTLNNFSAAIENTGSSDIQWIDFTVPSDYFTYAGNSISDWSTSDHTGGTTLTGNTLTPGSTGGYTLAAISGVVDTGAVNWQVLVSDDPSGANPTTCQGDLGTSISGYPPNDSSNGISTTVVSDITDSSTTITWDSDYPTSSLVYYGETSNYNHMSAYDPTLETSHSVTLTGLSENTGYHFQAIGSDSQGSTAYSSDGTFLTSSTKVTNGSPSTPPATTLSTPNSIIVGKGSNADVVAPSITLNALAPGSYKDAPTFSGTASDDKAVAIVEYSTDGGKNWLPVSVLAMPGQPKVTFTFKPLLPQDGNYAILARVTDGGGNTTTTASMILVIDRLPPIVGGNIVSSGPQVVQPSSDGTINALEGVDQKITLSVVGGPTSISLEATTNVSTKTGNKKYTQNFNMTLSPDTGLWSGILSFNRPGTYTLAAHAIDGAGNKTDRVLNTVHVVDSGHSFDKATNKPLASTVTVYYLEPESHTWVVWDGGAFGQINPQKTDQKIGKTGAFSILLPAGTYYVQAKAPGYHTMVGSIFTLKQPTPLASNLYLNPLRGAHFGNHTLSLPSFTVQHTSVSSNSSKNVNSSNLIGKQAPDFNLTDTTGATVNSIDLRGSPTLISFESTWSPTTAEQLAALSALQANPNLNVIPVATGEQADVVQAYTAMAGVELRWLLDTNSTLSSSYNVQSLPLHYFIDRTGIIRQVVVGVLSEAQMQKVLTSL